MKTVKLNPDVKQVITYADTLIEQHKNNPKPQEPPRDIISFCENLPIGQRDKFTFEGREWLREILTCTANTIVMTKGRQIGWSVLLSALMSFYALKYPGSEIIYCTMRQEQFRYFSLGRLRPMIIRQEGRLDRGEDRIKSMRLNNGSLITLISGADEFAQALGYTADIIMLDEAEKLPMHAVGKIQETLHASKIKRMYVGGTGGLEGSDWERYWLNSTCSEWDGKQWVATNPDSNKVGFHIPQKLSPHWNETYDNAKQREYSKMVYDTEVLGIFSREAEIPLPESLVRTRKQGEAWHYPNKGNYTVGIDLAAGGMADTVMVAVEELNGHVYLREAARTDLEYTSDIYPVIERFLHKWQPSAVGFDAGGNKELKRELELKTNGRALFMGSPNTEIKYGEEADTINRTFFIQRVIGRFHDNTITLPIPEPWVVEQLSAEKAVTRKSIDRGTYLAYEKMDSRKDDLLMALTFAEAILYSKSDKGNPQNKRIHWNIEGKLKRRNTDHDHF